MGHPVYGLEKCDVSWDTLYMDMKNGMKLRESLLALVEFII